MWAGAKAYDIVAGRHNAVPASYFVPKDEAVYQFPMLKADGLKGEQQPGRRRRRRCELIPPPPSLAP